MNFAILAIHGEKVTTVEGNVARVRLFLADGQVVDEDFELPPLPPASQPEESLYQHLLTPAIETRIAVLEGRS